MPAPDHDLPDGTPAWWADAACAGADPDLFHPEGGGQGQADVWDAGRQICRRCPVARDCLLHAIDGGEPRGMWGGLTRSERRALTSTHIKRYRPARLAEHLDRIGIRRDDLSDLHPTIRILMKEHP